MTHGKKLILNIIFQVRDLDNSMTKEEYAKYFLKNYVKIFGISKIKIDRKGEIITNGNATLTLKQGEKEVKTFEIEENMDYESSNPNEKQYILNIYNKSNNLYSDLRVNMFTKNDNISLIDISPSEVICEHSESITFEIPTWIYITNDTAISVYITVITNNGTFNPDIIVTSLID